MRQVTAGIYIFDSKDRLLVCHPNEVIADRWGIPKGRPNDGESIPDAAIREVYEETGIDLIPYVKDGIYVGEEDYKNKYKTLMAYTVRLDKIIPIDELHCDSLFKSRYSGDMIPEIDKYRWVNFDTFKSKIQGEQVRLWENYIGGHNKR